jgi:hypothetical protein
MPASDHSSLPLPDYDHLALPALGHRVRSLTAEEISTLLSYEHEHANRPAAVQIFQARLAELKAGDSPSGGRQRVGPEWPEPPSAGSRVGPATAAPPSSPPPHGTPDQPARPKGNRQAP